MSEREKDLEAYLGREVKKVGCLYYKFVSPGNRGVPDRMIVRPDGFLMFVELKTEVGKLSALQKSQIRKLEEFNQNVYVLYGRDDVENFLEEWIR